MNFLETDIGYLAFPQIISVSPVDDQGFHAVTFSGGSTTCTHEQLKLFMGGRPPKGMVE